MMPHQLAQVLARPRVAIDTGQRSTPATGFGTTDSGHNWIPIQNKSSQYVDPAFGLSVTNTVSFAVSVIDVGAVDASVAVTYSGMSGTLQGIALHLVDISNFIYIRIGTTSVAILSRINGSYSAVRAQKSMSIKVGDVVRAVCLGAHYEVYVNDELATFWDDPEARFVTSTRHGVTLSNAAVHIRRVVISPVSEVRAASREITFRDRFASSDLSNYATIFHRETIAFVDDPLGSGRKVVKMTVPNTAVGPSVNVRCQMQPPPNITPDMDFWVSVAVMFPSGSGPTAGDPRFPLMPTAFSGWFNFCQLYNGDPEGSAPVKLGFRADSTDQIIWQRNGTYGSDQPWRSAAITRDKWYEFAFRIYTSADTSLGFAELWMNDGAGWVQQDLFAGTPQATKRVYMKTLDPSANTKALNRWDSQNYRKVDMFPFDVVTYLGAHRIGHTLADVDPGFYPA